jgi:uncharacterized protein YbaP (TraB family)
LPEEITNQSNSYPEDVQIVRKDGREFIIVGTAHISRHSADLVKKVIEKEKPDVVCVELDEKRMIALSEKNRWENLDLKSIIKQKQLSTLIVNLVRAIISLSLNLVITPIFGFIQRIRRRFFLCSWMNSDWRFLTRPIRKNPS